MISRRILSRVGLVSLWVHLRSRNARRATADNFRLNSERKLERETGFEPATSTLARSHSTTELFPLAANNLLYQMGYKTGKNGRDLPRNHQPGRKASL